MADRVKLAGFSAFIGLANVIDGLMLISQISAERVDSLEVKDDNK